MGNNKNKRKGSHSDKGANSSRPRLNSRNFGNSGGKARTNNDANGEHKNKGRVPQNFSECRICERKGHWESDCRKNPAGEGKRGGDLQGCRECGGDHWEDRCRKWKLKTGGMGNDNNSKYKGKGQETSDSNSTSTSHSTEFLAPSGEDISRFFPNGKYPNRPCRKCNQAGHWNNACEKDGFHPVGNPNPGAAAGARKVGFLDGRSSGQIDEVFNLYRSPPGTGSMGGGGYRQGCGDGDGDGDDDVEMEMEMGTGMHIAKTKSKIHSTNTSTPTPVPPTTSLTLPDHNPISSIPGVLTQIIPRNQTPSSTKLATAHPSAPSANPTATNPTTVSPTAGSSLAPITNGVPIPIFTIPQTR
ncbi:hypothetical protein BOTCAL_1374g00020 [Botryotinia calthae]|uniref:CCHC-type domain-containing protein n=1 Tax=Botryotinia calthae TaxID=38488 RepID=A0A4Y8CCB4_9HELO|nr:hypothetical protein BOTCAL_1374g00020 [Botryotinia calthae]